MFSNNPYYRSDTRHPTIIFKDGFKARKEYTDDWWLQGLRYDCGAIPKDVNEEYAVCTSTCFEASAIFPTNYTVDPFIYVIFNEESKKVNIDHKKNGKDKYTVPEKVTSSTVIDMHSLQVEEIGVAIKKEIAVNPLAYDDHLGSYAGCTLYGYEAFTNYISSEKIYCAIRIIRDTPQYYETKLHDSTNTVNQVSMPYLSFKIKEIILNDKFNLTKFIEQKINSSISQIQVEIFDKLRMNKKFSTPHPLWGLGGKILPSPIKSSTDKIRSLNTFELKACIRSNLLSKSIFCNYLKDLGKTEEEIIKKIYTKK